MPPPPAVAATPVATARPAVRPPARILVFAREHHLNPSRRVIPSGRVIIQMRNIGEDDHDLAVRTGAGRVVARMPDIRPGRTGEIRTRLAPGRYQLVCRITGHEGQGMVTGLLVKRAVR